MVKILVASKSECQKGDLLSLLLQERLSATINIDYVDNIGDTYIYAIDKRPEMLIIDSDMLCSDSLNIIGKIKGLLPYSFLVLVTEMNNFPFYQEQIGYEIDYYLFRPYDCELVYKVFTQALSDIKKKKKQEKEYKSIKKQIDLYGDLIEKETIIRLCNTNIGSKESKEYGELLGILDKEFLCIVIHKGSKINQGNILKSLKIYLTHYANQIIGFTTLGTICLFVFTEYGVLEKKKQQIQDDIQVFLKWKYKEGFKLKCSEVYQNVKYVKIAQEEAVSQLCITNVLDDEYHITNKESMLKEAVLKGDKEGIESLFLELCLFIKEYADDNEEFYKDYIKQLYFRVIRATGNYFTNYSSTEELTTTIDTINSIKEFYGMVTYVQGLIVDLSVMLVNSRTSRNRKVEAVKEYINCNYSEKITLEELADLISVSETHLSKLFRKVEGMTIKNYITEVKMKKSIELFRDNNISVSQVAYALGYAEPNYFSRVFKKYTGISPKEYINSH